MKCDTIIKTVCHKTLVAKRSSFWKNTNNGLTSEKYNKWFDFWKIKLQQNMTSLSGRVGVGGGVLVLKKYTIYKFRKKVAPSIWLGAYT